MLPGRLWLLVAALLALGALGGIWVGAAAWDWQPQRAAAEPWRWWSAAFVHWSALHLGANMIGLALVTALGWVARAPTAIALAWFVAWPLTHLGLLLQPGLAHYGGLSGVLHAGVGAAATGLALGTQGWHRRVAVALLTGLVLKLLFEQPWGTPLRHPAGWDIAVAPLAHATGALAGIGCALLALGARRLRLR